VQAVSPGLEGITSADAFAYIEENISEFDALLPLEVHLPDDEIIVLPESAEIEEYLLEELGGHDIEELF
jgi:hypothetical protein